MNIGLLLEKVTASSHIEDDLFIAKLYYQRIKKYGHRE